MENKLHELAKECGATVTDAINYHFAENVVLFDNEDALQMFVERVAAAEREACAKVCEELVAEVSPRDKWTPDAAVWEAESVGVFDGATDCADHIRARSNQANYQAANDTQPEPPLAA